MIKLLHESLTPKCNMDVNSNNEKHTHQGVDSRQTQKVNVVLKEITA